MFNLIPFENSLFNQLDNFDRFFGNFPPTAGSFRTDIVDKGDKYLLKADIPGFTKEDISLDITENMLMISAEHKDETEDKSENFIRRERRYGSFCRGFDISDISREKISASYENGVLCIDLPKKTPAAPETKRVPIS